MKKLNLSILILVISLIFTSCSNNAQDYNQNNLEATSQTDEEKINNLFEGIDSAISNKLVELNKSAKKSDSEMAITFLVVKDNKSGAIALANFTTESIFPLPNSLFSKSSEEKYTVSCSGGSKEDWTSSCSGKFSCGTKIAKCLEQGGCSSICAVKDQGVKFNSAQFFGIKKAEKNDFDLEDISAVQIAFNN